MNHIYKRQLPLARSRNQKVPALFHGWESVWQPFQDISPSPCTGKSVVFRCFLALWLITCGEHDGTMRCLFHVLIPSQTCNCSSQMHPSTERKLWTGDWERLRDKVSKELLQVKRHVATCWFSSGWFLLLLVFWCKKMSHPLAQPTCFLAIKFSLWPQCPVFEDDFCWYSWYLGSSWCFKHLEWFSLSLRNAWDVSVTRPVTPVWKRGCLPLCKSETHALSKVLCWQELLADLFLAIFSTKTSFFKVWFTSKHFKTTYITVILVPSTTSMTISGVSEHGPQLEAIGPRKETCDA